MRTPTMKTKIERPRDPSEIRRQYDLLGREIFRLRKENDITQAKAILMAYRKSRKTFAEVMTFLRF